MITMTIQEVLHGSIEQIEHLQNAITDLTREPMLKSTQNTIKMLEDVISTNVVTATIFVQLHESEYVKPVVTKLELTTRLYNLVNVLRTYNDATPSGKEALKLRILEAEETLKNAIQ